MLDGSSPAWTAALAVLALGVACSAPRDAIIVNEGMLVVENQSSREWRNVTITINDHYRGGAPSLRPGARLNAPLRDFRTGFGHPFDRGRMSVYRVRVSATDSAGRPVALAWGRP